MTMTNLTLLPCFDYTTFPFFLARKNERKVVVVNCVTAKMFTLINLRQQHVNSELTDFEFTYTLRQGSQTPPKAEDLEEIRLHYKEV